MKFALSGMGTALCLIAGLMVTQPAAAQAHLATSDGAKTSQSPQSISPEAVFSRWDKDADKTLSADEFKAGWQELQAAMALRKLHENFMAMDANRNGRLDAAEYANLELVRKAGTSAPSISAFDADKNQALDFREYVAMVQSMFKQRH